MYKIKKMLKKNFLFLILSIFFVFDFYGNDIKILYTSALIKHQFQKRRLEYLQSLHKLKEFGFEPWIIEATNIRSSFFDQITNQIFYPNVNNPNLKNLGVKEAQSIKACLNKLPFSDEDIIVKITGRYIFQDDFFFNTIKNNPDYDAYVKWMGSQVFTGVIAIRWAIFKEILNSINFEYMEKNSINFEKIIADYILKNKIRSYPISVIHVSARIFGNNGGPIIYDF
jgi:hypothetical protein